MQRQVSSENSAGFHRIELVQEAEGVYIFICERADSAFPERDYLVDNFEVAHEACAEDYGVPLESWSAIPASSTPSPKPTARGANVRLLA